MTDQALAAALSTMVTTLVRLLRPAWRSQQALALFIAIAIPMALLAWAAGHWGLFGLAWEAVQRVVVVILAGLGLHAAKDREANAVESGEQK